MSKKLDSFAEFVVHLNEMASDSYDSTIPADHWLNQPIKRELKWYEKPRKSQEEDDPTGHFSVWAREYAPSTSTTSHRVALMSRHEKLGEAKKRIQEYINGKSLDGHFFIVKHKDRQEYYQLLNVATEANNAANPQADYYRGIVMRHLNKKTTHAADVEPSATTNDDSYYGIKMNTIYPISTFDGAVSAWHQYMPLSKQEVEYRKETAAQNGRDPDTEWHHHYSVMHDDKIIV